MPWALTTDPAPELFNDIAVGEPAHWHAFQVFLFDPTGTVSALAEPELTPSQENNVGKPNGTEGPQNAYRDVHECLGDEVECSHGATGCGRDW